MTTTSAAGATDPGQRPYNEDAFLVAESVGLYVVADGVGGREAGEIASKMACEVILASIERGLSLKNAIGDAHQGIREAIKARNASDLTAMASTVVALQLNDESFTLAWTGDSRGYLWDGSQLWGLTRDHSLVEALVARGELTREQAKDHPQKNVILAALGGESPDIEIGINRGNLPRQGTFLLCSDGLTDALALSDICSLLASSSESVQERADNLAHLARDRGGRDNITVLLLEAQSSSKDPSRAPAVYELFDPASGDHSWSSYAEPVEDEVEERDDLGEDDAGYTQPQQFDMEVAEDPGMRRELTVSASPSYEPETAHTATTTVLLAAIAVIVVVTLATLLLGAL